MSSFGSTKTLLESGLYRVKYPTVTLDEKWNFIEEHRFIFQHDEFIPPLQRSLMAQGDISQNLSAPLGDDADNYILHPVSPAPNEYIHPRSPLFQFRLPSDFHFVSPTGLVMNLHSNEYGYGIETGRGGDYAIFPPRDHTNPAPVHRPLNNNFLLRATFNKRLAVLVDSVELARKVATGLFHISMNASGDLDIPLELKHIRLPARQRKETPPREVRIVLKKAAPEPEPKEKAGTAKKRRSSATQAGRSKRILIENAAAGPPDSQNTTQTNNDDLVGEPEESETEKTSKKAGKKPKRIARASGKNMETLREFMEAQRKHAEAAKKAEEASKEAAETSQNVLPSIEVEGNTQKTTKPRRSGRVAKARRSGGLVFRAIPKAAPNSQELDRIGQSDDPIENSDTLQKSPSPPEEGFRIRFTIKKKEEEPQDNSSIAEAGMSEGVTAMATSKAASNPQQTNLLGLEGGKSNAGPAEVEKPSQKGKSLPPKAAVETHETTEAQNNEESERVRLDSVSNEKTAEPSTYLSDDGVIDITKLNLKIGDPTPAATRPAMTRSATHKRKQSQEPLDETTQLLKKVKL
ncbi:hypothetical protein GGR52DRAFT_549367 [Hypoxylon sp. FL1284]|nr:hypothetical protein GGR52DRAFT_549367 [Hypoxylon sp. FL1284]